MITVNEIAKLLDGKVVGDGNAQIHGMSAPSFAKEGEITFIADEKNFEEAGKSAASCVLTAGEAPDLAKTAILVKDMKLAVTMLYNIIENNKPPAKGTIHKTAVLAGNVKLGKNVSIGPYAIVGKNTTVGDNSSIGANCVIGKNVKIGASTQIYPNVTIYDLTVIGNKVGIHSGSVIGADGFGYVSREGKVYKVPQLGNVVIEDEVEIGANTCIDRGTFTTTVIGKGSKLDNLVQIAHNDKIGRNVMVAAQTGIAGSSSVGDGTLVGGQVGVADHVKIGSNVKIGAQSGVIGLIRDNETIFGYPAKDAKKSKSELAFLSWLEKHSKKLRKLLREVSDE